MRSIILVLLFTPFASAQTPEIDAAVKAKLATLKFLGSLYDAESGGYCAEPKGKPSLRATNAAVKATKYLGGKLDDKDKTAKFVLACYDDKTGGFAEPGGKADVTTACIGVMAAMELGIAKEKIVKAPEYITANAKTFEGVRIGAAAIEAWGGIMAWPVATKEWNEVLWWEWGEWLAAPPSKDSDWLTTLLAALNVTYLRLGKTLKTGPYGNRQREDGGWIKSGEGASDMESTYRVMRHIYMLEDKPKDPAKLREFIAKHRNADGGYATKPGEKSSASGTYYTVIVTKWLDELEKK